MKGEVYSQMEELLQKKFNLKCAIVVPVPEQYTEDKEQVKKMVALEGARYVQRIINDGDIIGLNWGGTMYHLIQYLNPCRKVPASIITMHGSIEQSDKKFQVKSLVRRAAMSFGGTTMITTAAGDTVAVSFCLNPMSHLTTRASFCIYMNSL